MTRKNSRPFRLSPNTRRMIKAGIHFLALSYIALLFYAGINDQLGPDPVQVLLDETGIWAIYLLMVTLVLSPIGKKIKSQEPTHFRRLLGVYSFVYALTHFFVYCVFEIQLDFTVIVTEIIDRPYITVGMTALAILLALSVTSPNHIRRKLGKNWQTLHNGVYIALPLVVLHYTWAQKSGWISAFIYWFITLVILTLRKDKLNRFFTRIQRRRTKAY